jgi:hypothetical protein
MGLILRAMHVEEFYSTVGLASSAPITADHATYYCRRSTRFVAKITPKRGTFVIGRNYRTRNGLRRNYFRVDASSMPCLEGSQTLYQRRM